jgi:hypothetical protein
MAYSVELKDQQLLVILSLDDALEAVGEYAGEELKRYLASYYEVNLADVDDYEKILDQMEQDVEMCRKHYQNTLLNLLEKTESMTSLLNEKHLNREIMGEAVTQLSNCIWSELNK